MNAQQLEYQRAKDSGVFNGKELGVIKYWLDDMPCLNGITYVGLSIRKASEVLGKNEEWIKYRIKKHEIIAYQTAYAYWCVPVDSLIATKRKLNYERDHQESA